MKVGQKTTTATGDPHEIKSIGKVFAKTYQLDGKGKRIKLKFGKKGYLEGRITIKEHKSLSL